MKKILLLVPSLSLLLLFQANSQTLLQKDDLPHTGTFINTNATAPCDCDPLPAPTNTTIRVNTVTELQAALQQANTNNGNRTILLEDGTYQLTTNLLYIGTNMNNLTLRSISGNRDAVIIRGQGMNGNISNIFTVAASNFTVADMTIGWVANHPIQIQGEQNADNCLIQNVRFVDAHEQLLKVSGSAAVESSDNGVVQCCLFEFSAGVANQWYTGGIDAHQAQNWIVRNNTFKDIRSPDAGLAEHAIHFWNGAAGTIVENNSIINCDRGIGFGLGDRSHTGGIIRNNMVHTSRDVGIGLESASNAKVYNNTVITDNYFNSIEYRFTETANAHIANNLTTASISARNGGTGTIENNFTNNDRSIFVDADNYDFHLAAAQSQIINEGILLPEISIDYDCENRLAAPDIGADEYETSEEDQNVVKTKPVLLYSDIESGPKNGWSQTEPNKGVAVSIWGTGFGTSRGTSYVTVNGTRLNTVADYAVWGEYWPTQYFQRITFWLNDEMRDGVGEISITVDGIESNSLPFTIRAGNIYFITASNLNGNGTLNNPYEIDNATYNWVDNMQPGDLYYFREAQVYEGKYNGGNSVLWIRDTEPSGTASLPISFLAFPSEKPVFSVPIADINHNNGIKLNNNYMVCSGFSIDSEWTGASMDGDFHRFIGNDVIGLKDWYFSGSGILTSGNNWLHTGDGNKFLGNAIHGGNSQNRFDHGIYLYGCSDKGGAEVGWNHFYDNNFGRGPIISINHQDQRCDLDQVLDAHFIFNNIVDCSVARSTAVGVFDLSYDDGEPAPEPTYVYNNLIISCGTYNGTNREHIGWTPAMYQSAGVSARFYNNTLYDSGYVGFQVYNNATSSSIKNNIIHINPDFPGPTGNHYLILEEESIVSLSNNLYYGLGEYARCDNCLIDQDNINNQDPLFVDAANNDLQLLDNSSAIDAGSVNLAFEVTLPSYAPINRDLNFVLRTPTDIGAYEYTTDGGIGGGGQEECLVERTHPNEVLSAGIYPTKDNLYSQAIIESTVTYKVGNSINLQDGFHAKVGSEFLAMIENCTPSQRITENLPAASYPSLPIKKINKAQQSLALAPNPTGSATTLYYELVAPATLSLDLYNVTGKRVMTILPSTSLSSGKYQQSVNVSPLPKGMYLVVMRTQAVVMVEKIIIE